MEGWSQYAIAAKHRDLRIRKASRSGGIFTAISDVILSQGGAVYGCVMKDASHAVHVRAEDCEERDRMRGSKYIQSDLGDTFSLVRKDLEAGRQVLFTGTGCQVSGLKQFLASPFPNLVCLDLVCHGVPSRKVWDKQLNFLTANGKKEIVAVDFRDKKNFGWADHVETITLCDQRREYRIHSRVFKTLFYEHYILRPSCHFCPNKSLERSGDLTLADFWGIDKAISGFNDNQGVSLVLVNSQRGKELLSEVTDLLEMKEVDIRQGMQASLKNSFQMPTTRKAFWIAFYEKGFSFVIKRYTWKPRFREWKKRQKRIVRKFVQKKIKGV